MWNVIFANPYHHSGAMLARTATNTATIIWALLVLWNDEALGPTPYGKYLTGWFHEDWWAVFFLVISSFMLWRLIRKHKPHSVGIVGYGLLGAAWLYVDVVFLFFQRPIYPTSTAWITVGTALALYGFIANPRPCNVAAR